MNLKTLLHVAEAKYKGMEETVKVLGDVIVKITMENQSLGRKEAIYQPQQDEGFGQALASANMSQGMAGARQRLNQETFLGHQMTQQTTRNTRPGQQKQPKRSRWKKQLNQQKVMSPKKAPRMLPEGWRLRRKRQ